jgi:hypothetical protein
MRRSISVILALFLVIPVLVLADEPDFRSFIGGCTPPANINWENPSNWSPSAVPCIWSRVTIAYSSPYAAVTGAVCTAFDVTVQSGGKLALRAVDHLKVLAVVTDITVNAGGSFVGVGGSGTGGPVVLVGGDIVNDGTWDLSGIATGHPAVALLGCTTQRITGSHLLVFQNLLSEHQFIVDGVDVYVVGNYTGPWPQEINNGHFIVGEHPLPITLAYFTAAFDARANGVKLTWRTVSEINNYGFYVERRSSETASYEPVAFVPTQGNGIAPHEYALSDASVPAGSWLYRLRQVDLDGTESTTEDVHVEISGLTSVGNGTAPVAFELAQNFPNPFNPETLIRFSVEAAGTARLKVYDTVGREVATLFDGAAESGRYYTVSFNGAGLSSGTYFYRLESGSKIEMKRMALVK